MLHCVMVAERRHKNWGGSAVLRHKFNMLQMRPTTAAADRMLLHWALS
jgi:hypothetical protein